MKTYLVGGAVRDKLLGLPIIDRDWVVVGETPDAMRKAGFIAVGKDFPVFLHPETHEEYALARKERKTGPGYHGFEFDTAATVTLEEDLSRRDLTVNAIAEDDQGNLIDPFNGVKDLNARTFRHVSPAFAEDPVRVLRLAKFMARFSHYNFNVAEDTTKLIRSMVASGEVDNLVAERVWKELEAALKTKKPSAFFVTLLHTNALARILPEFLVLPEQMQPGNNTAEATRSIDAFLTTAHQQALEKACALSTESQVRFAAMCANFRPEGVPQLEAMCERLRVSKTHTELAVLAARYTETAQLAVTLTADQMHTLLKALDVSRRPERLDAFLLAVKANDQSTSDRSAALLQLCAQAMRNVNAGKLAQAQTDKSQIPKVIKQHELAAIEVCLQQTVG